MRWRVSEHGIFAGTLRIARFDFDTDPSEEYKEGLYAEMEAKLNAEEHPAAARRMFEAAAVLVNPQTLSDIQALAEEDSNGSTIEELAKEEHGKGNNLQAGVAARVVGQGKEAGTVAEDSACPDSH